MDTRFCYIDDEPIENLLPFIEGIERKNPGLKLIHQPHVPFNQLNKILSGSNFDGFLLDLQLKLPATDEQTKDFWAPTIAQQIRFSAEKHADLDVPIVLCSNDQNLQRYETISKPAHNLYDLVYRKMDLSRSKKFELTALSSGYKFIKKHQGIQKFHKIMSLEPDVWKSQRIDLNPFFNPSNHITLAHELAWFILRELIEKAGPLIDEYVLAARLGIDIDQSSDWKNLKNELVSTVYTGPFSHAWKRWWATQLEEWWYEKVLHTKKLGFLNAGQRVEAIKNYTGLQALCPYEAPDGGSDLFWTSCKSTHKPIDPIDGVVISSITQDWQDKDYISLSAYYNRDYDAKSIKFDPLSEQRAKERGEAMWK